jgi:hypothetical protein
MTAPHRSIALRRALLVLVVVALVAASVALGWVAAHWGLQEPAP